jgi:hypothetical protein
MKRKFNEFSRVHQNCEKDKKELLGKLGKVEIEK